MFIDIRLVHWTKPYKGILVSQVRLAVLDRDRMNIADSVTTEIRSLIESCWAHDPEKRPTFEQLSGSLKAIVADLKEKPVHVSALRLDEDLGSFSLIL